jgi:hypothetical protein
MNVRFKNGELIKDLCIVNVVYLWGVFIGWICWGTG